MSESRRSVSDCSGGVAEYDLAPVADQMGVERVRPIRFDPINGILAANDESAGLGENSGEDQATVPKGVAAYLVVIFYSESAGALVAVTNSRTILEEAVDRRLSGDQSSNSNRECFVPGSTKIDASAASGDRLLLTDLVTGVMQP